MALSRLLLLCMVASEVWNAETRPIDFVCDRESRRDMNTVAEMAAALADCDGLKMLPSPIQLPCIKVHKASWERKSAQEKKGDIAATLRALSRSVSVVKTLSQPGCAATLLERLEHTVNNYLHIITHLDIRGSVESPLFSSTAESTHSLSTVLWTFSRLITGKMEWLMADLTHGCP
uniref:Thrombopoietin n=1 Tax=Oncorhynchus tshawytscha TaxID=74940 RepID=A0A8C8JDQ1_ONCTS